MQGQRLDKWLWCVRLVKTRTLAAKLITDGHLRVNGARAAKPSQPVKPGDVVTGTVARRLFVVRVAGSAERRGPASVAQTLYDDLTPMPNSKARPSIMRRGPRPTKRERRRFDAMDADGA